MDVCVMECVCDCVSECGSEGVGGICFHLL